MLIEYQYLTAIGELLLTNPYPVPLGVYPDYYLIGMTGIDYGRIFQGEGSDHAGAGIMLRSGGINTVREKKDVTGVITLRQRANFSIEIWREQTSSQLIAEVSNYLNLMINWINEENHRRGKSTQNPKLPKFSMTNFEALTADGGVRTGIAPEPDNRAIYGIGIHADFELVKY